MGRLLVFLARLNGMPGSIPPSPVTRGIGIEERAAVLLDPDGAARVIGRGGAYFIESPNGIGLEMPRRPLTWQPYMVQKVTPGHTFNLKTWTGESTAYQLTVKGGQITSMQHGGVIY
jgi:cyanophycinase-like exopeptidase